MDGSSVRCENIGSRCFGRVARLTSDNKGLPIARTDQLSISIDELLKVSCSALVLELHTYLQTA